MKKLVIIVDNEVDFDTINNDCDLLEAMLKNMKFRGKYKGTGEIHKERLFTGNWMVVIDIFDWDESERIYGAIHSMMRETSIHDKECTYWNVI